MVLRLVPGEIGGPRAILRRARLLLRERVARVSAVRSYAVADAFLAAAREKERSRETEGDDLGRCAKWGTQNHDQGQTAKRSYSTKRPR